MNSSSLNAFRPARRRQSGFTLLNVLVAAFLFGMGMLGIVRAFGGVISASTQNEYMTSLATLGNSFWATMQANPTLAAPSFNATYNATTYTSAPPAMQPWLKELMQTLPTASATVSTGNDSHNNQPCNYQTGCMVYLSISWNQSGMAGSAAVMRSQTFQYRISQS